MVNSLDALVLFVLLCTLYAQVNTYGENYLAIAYRGVTGVKRRTNKTNANIIINNVKKKKHLFYSEKNQSRWYFIVY